MDRSGFVNVRYFTDGKPSGQSVGTGSVQSVAREFEQYGWTPDNHPSDEGNLYRLKRGSQEVVLSYLTNF